MTVLLAWFPLPYSATPSIQRSPLAAWIGEGLFMIVWFGNYFSYSTLKIITHECEILRAQSSFTGAGTKLLLQKFFTLCYCQEELMPCHEPLGPSLNLLPFKNHCLLSFHICKSKSFLVWKIKPHKKNHIYTEHNFEKSRILACKMPDTSSQFFKPPVRRDGQINNPLWMLL